MPEYGRFCPVAMATDVLADRWTPLVVRELVMGNTRFNDIARGLPGISRTLLTQRLRHLERKGVLQRWPIAGRGSEYHLTPAGKALTPVLAALGEWAVEWLFAELHPEEIDAQTLMWWWHHNLAEGTQPPGRVVIQFDHTGPTRVSAWLVLENGGASVCIQHPGFEVDVVVRAETPVLGAVFGGLRSWSSAVADGSVVVDGPARLVKALPTWFAWSPFAPLTAAKVAGRG